MQTVGSMMTVIPVALPEQATLSDAARAMRGNAIGAIMVVRNGQLQGLVTDRDIVVRALAAGRDPSTVTIGEICTPEPATAPPDEGVDAVIRLMRDRAVRRVPVVQHGKPAGMVSLSDLAVRRGDIPLLADICAVPPDFPRNWESR